ncbi:MULTISPECIES: GNAT family N-acetyltransferase [Actinosynnema]|uniref:GNAT family N-acetyltransferase n=1 Tax=Actinosynnema TaxID=40566 RepID=UPI0020A3EA5A|nr:GNAT family N-acetyltransferase [Actinosynnema pretiosum]MCP2092130.1 Ribosomal protein S18 acetylase RimI [Actinosynnema pretiosum]
MPALTLFRLYDLPAEPPGGWTLEPASPLALRALWDEWGADGEPPWPAPAGELLLATENGKPVGCAGVNHSALGEVGPLLRAPVLAGRADLAASLLHGALWRLRWLGHAYGFAPADVAAHADEVLRAALWEVPDNAGSPPAERDVPEQEWGDVLVDLRDWPPPRPVAELELDGDPVLVRRPEASEQLLVVDWIRDAFGRGWAAEFTRAFAHDPVSAVIVARPRGFAEDPRRCLLGFIAYNTVRAGMLSSIALSAEIRGRDNGIAARLLSSCLSEVRAHGFQHAVLGGVSRRLVALRAVDAAWTVPGSCPGVFGKGIRDR